MVTKQRKKELLQRILQKNRMKIMINGFIRFRSNLRKNDKKSSVSHKAEHKEQISKINIQISEIQKQISTLQTEK